MRILVCNDDGIDAPGVRHLAIAARVLGSDIWVVAPDRKWTAASHQLSFDRDLTLTRRSEQVFACSGAPADCVVAAMTILFADGRKPDLVLAGINDKRNVGEDLAYSGTMAIAREGTFWGVPAIGVSRASYGGAVDDECAVLATLHKLLPAFWQSRDQWAANGHWLSVNLPTVLPAPVTQAPVVQASMGRHKIGAACDVLLRTPERITYRLRRGRAGSGTPGDESWLIDSGRVTVARHCWFAPAQLPESLVAQWSEAATQSA